MPVYNNTATFPFITVVPSLTFQQCLDACDATCAFVNYNYDTGDCQVVRPDTASAP